MYEPLSSLIPTPDALLNSELWQLGLVLLTHLKSHEGSTTGVYQNGLISYTNLLTHQSHVGKPEYGGKQPEVDRALAEAWNWLQRQGLVNREDGQPAPWFRISRDGEEFLKQKGRFDHWEKLGVSRVKGDLESTGGIRDVGGTLETRDWAWKWVAMKEKAQSASSATSAAGVELTLISAQRVVELRTLNSTAFDFRKLIRLCEEINITYRNECYFATAMLARALLDHVPPIFGMRSFAEVANNYGGKSFKGTMQHLEEGLRNVADGHLHQQIRKSESVPTAQQVNFAAPLDMLLSEIVRISK